MEAYPKLFPMPPRAAKMNCQYLVIVFKDRAGYQNFLISQGAGSAAGWSGGVHWADWMPREGGWPRLYVMTFPWTEGQTDINGFNRGVLQHEGAHAMLRRFVGRLENGVYDMPTAFNEGMACYFECWNLRQDIPTNRKERSARSEHWPFLKRWAAENSDWQPDLRALLDIKDEYGWAPDGGGPNTHLNYALSETLIDYLTSTPKLRATFKAMIQNMYARKPLLTAKELAAMEPEWRKHIKMLIETTPDVPAGARLTLKTERKEGKVVGWRIEGAALPEAVLEAVNAGIREALAADPTLSDEVLQKALDETLAKIRNTKEEKAPEETKKTDDPAPPKDKKK